jgi:hypothetical protein
MLHAILAYMPILPGDEYFNLIAASSAKRAM